MTKVLYVLERWPELSQTFVAEEIRALLELECEVEVACIARGSGADPGIPSQSFADTPPGKRVAAALGQAASAPIATFRQIITERSWPPPRGSQRLKGLARLAPFRQAALRADHIHAHFATEGADIARLLAATTGRSWSFTAHGRDAYGSQTALATNLASAAFARAASPHVAEQLRAANSGARVIEIPVAVALDLFERRDPYNGAGPVVSTGRLIEKKGFEDLINAFRTARLDDRELLIIGEGPLRRDLEGRAEGLDVRFLGALPPSEVAAIVKQASVFALLSKVAADGDRDGRPAALVEAMAAGIPVLSTEVPGISDLVHPDCGVLVEPGSAVLAAVALRELVDLPTGAREAMGAAGQARSQAYSPEAVAEELLAQFNLATSGS
jgi:glycosyltransferase involved in cell wall biosynthesis